MAQLELADDGETIILDVPYVAFEAVRTIPGARRDNKRKIWTLPLTWPSCVMARSTFGPDLKVGPNLTAWAKHTKINRIDHLEKLRRSKGGSLGGLRPHQEVGVRFIAAAGSMLLADDMRVGKTAQVITAIGEMEDALPVLVVCPATVKEVWRQEFARWSPNTVVAVPKSGTVAATKAVKEIQDGVADVVVLNYEQVPLLSRLASYGSIALEGCKECNPLSTKSRSRCQREDKALNETGFGTIVADEVHRIKEPTAQATRALWYLGDHARYRIGMTGTPPGDPSDFWSIMRFIAPDEFPARWKFMERFATLQVNPWSGFLEATGWSAAAEDEREKVIGPRFLRRPKSVVHDVVEPIRETRHVTMSPKQAKAYKELKVNLVTQLETGVLWADDPLAKVLRLRQIASAYGVVFSEGGIGLSEPSSKLDALEDFLDNDMPGEPAVIFAESKQLINLLMNRWADKHAVAITGDVSQADRVYNIAAFQNGNAQYILCTTAAAAEGIRLDRADTLIFLQRPWANDKSKQAEERIYQEGRASLIVDFEVPDTVDSRVREALASKEEDLQDLVRDKETIARWLS